MAAPRWRPRAGRRGSIGLAAQARNTQAPAAPPARSRRTALLFDRAPAHLSTVGYSRWGVCGPAKPRLTIDAGHARRMQALSHRPAGVSIAPLGMNPAHRLHARTLGQCRRARRTLG